MTRIDGAAAAVEPPAEPWKGVQDPQLPTATAVGYFPKYSQEFEPHLHSPSRPTHGLGREQFSQRETKIPHPRTANHNSEN